jgi:hypothetical protein
LRGSRPIEKQGGIPALRYPTGSKESVMRIVPHLTMLAMAALIAAAPVCRGEVHARAEILPIEDKDLAKMDKEEVKRKRDQRKMEDDMSDTNDSGQCGSVSIGNNDSGNQRGSNRAAPRDTTVIVTGNVYNTASCGH